jgi:hypothetical protein
VEVHRHPDVILHRWHIVNGCIEWLAIRTDRYVGPLVRGLPSLGPCTKAGLLLPPLLGVPGGFMYPPGWWAQGPPYIYGAPPPPPSAVYASLPPVIGFLGGPLPPLDLYPPTSPPTEIIPAPPVLPPQLAATETPPSEAVPEPASVIALGIGATLAIIVRHGRRKETKARKYH